MRKTALGAAALALVLALLSGIFAAVAGVSACLPDLAPLPLEDSGAPLLVTQACGDGTIETLLDGGDAGESCDTGDASVPGCVRCQIDCRGGRVDPESHHCYFVVPGSGAALYKDAFDRCADEKAHLVTLGSEREVAFVDALDAGPYWVGLRTDPDLGGAYGPAKKGEPGWPLPPYGPCPGCFARANDAGLFDPAPGTDAGIGCVVAEGAQWYSVDCVQSGKKFRTVCEREPIGARVSDRIEFFSVVLPITAGKKEYLVSQGTTPRDVGGADGPSRRCADVGGTLLLLDSADEREQLVRAVTEHPRAPSLPATFWIGLRSEAADWVWDDDAGQAARPLPWGNGQPTAVGVGRAYLRIVENQYDSQLAYDRDVGEDAGTDPPRLFICQRPAAR